MGNEPVIVLGSGMGALGAACHVADAGLPVVLYDANSYPGGHTATFSVGGGFLFDDGPHVSFTKDERIRELLARNVDGAFEDVKARINNYWHGTWIPHPVQMHLYGLPTDLIVSIISDFVAARETGPSALTTTSNGFGWPTARRSLKRFRWSTDANTTRPRWTA